MTASLWLQYLDIPPGPWGTVAVCVVRCFGPTGRRAFWPWLTKCGMRAAPRNWAWLEPGSARCRSCGTDGKDEDREPNPVVQPGRTVWITAAADDFWGGPRACDTRATLGGTLRRLTVALAHNTVWTSRDVRAAQLNVHLPNFQAGIMRVRSACDKVPAADDHARATPVIREVVACRSEWSRSWKRQSHRAYNPATANRLRRGAPTPGRPAVVTCSSCWWGGC